MTWVRPKKAAGTYVRISLGCRVCDAELESYVIEAGPGAVSLHEAARNCATEMQAHLETEHGYPLSLFMTRPTVNPTEEKSDG